MHTKFEAENLEGETSSLARGCAENDLEAVDWVDVVQGKIYWRGFVNTAMSLQGL
jgi:hypothetical protein